MRIAVLGTGSVGRALAARLDEIGHEVTVGTRDVDAARSRRSDEGSGMEFGDWAQAHPSVGLAAFADAAAWGEVVVNATSGHVTLDVLEAAGGSNLAGKVVVDVSNPLDFSRGFPPRLFVADTDSLGERVQAAHPSARVVKALNTLTAELMVRPSQLDDGRHTVFVCGDDPDAKALVRDLLTSMGHTDVLDLGDISSSRGTEMFLPLWLRIMSTLGTGMFNVKVVRE